MQLRTRTAATLAVAASFVGLVGLAPTVSAAETPKASEGKYCATVVEPVKAGEKVSRVKNRVCADSRASAAAAVRQSASTLLMTWYDNANFGGGWNDLYGNFGPCDSAGYVLNTGLWRTSISSFRTYNNCDGQQAVLNNGSGVLYYYGYATSYVGDRANDNIETFKIFDA
ncbi:hypothetical protein ACIQAC_14160 [Streptomyces sp. NPDC088387]|uniref:hypothetical protein n=1 Tax=Streptomyces sp. NPDC088387 TaxID=3365859 RepID=UPI0038173698